jgi:hypothetical protein
MKTNYAGGEEMNKQPVHYDGSFQNNDAFEDATIVEQFNLTDEMRANISVNPFFTSIDK